MLVHITGVFTPEQAAACRAALGRARWIDGKTTAGQAAARVKQNAEADLTDPEVRKWSDAVRHALAASKAFMATALPARICPPSFNRYGGGQTYGVHNDAALFEFAQAGGSAWVRSDYDSANWIQLHEVFDTGTALNRHFDTLGRHIVSCHAKDIQVENRLSVHLQDGCPGQGLMDFATLFARLEALDPDYPAIAEGNSTEELPAVGALFHETAKKLGIRVLDAGERASR